MDKPTREVPRYNLRKGTLAPRLNLVKEGKEITWKDDFLVHVPESDIEFPDDSAIDSLPDEGRIMLSLCNFRDYECGRFDIVFSESEALRALNCQSDLRDVFQDLLEYVGEAYMEPCRDRPTPYIIYGLADDWVRMVFSAQWFRLKMSTTLLLDDEGAKVKKVARELVSKDYSQREQAGREF